MGSVEHDRLCGGGGGGGKGQGLTFVFSRPQIMGASNSGESHDFQVFARSCIFDGGPFPWD